MTRDSDPGLGRNTLIIASGRMYYPRIDHDRAKTIDSTLISDSDPKDQFPIDLQ